MKGQKMDKLVEAVAKWENECIKEFSNFVERDYGILYYNEDNKESYDSNHALIFDYSDLKGAIKDIEKFYREKGMKPRIFQANREGEEELLWPLLKEEGFTIEDSPELKLFVLRENSKTELPGRPEALEFRRPRVISKDIKELYFLDSGGDWGVLKLAKTINNSHYDLICGYDREDKVVTVGTLRANAEVVILEDVITHPDERGKGYGSALINFICNHHREKPRLPLALFAEDEGAIRIYRRAGFKEVPFPYKSWTSWKQ